MMIITDEIASIANLNDKIAEIKDCLKFFIFQDYVLDNSISTYTKSLFMILEEERLLAVKKETYMGNFGKEWETSMWYICDSVVADKIGTLATILNRASNRLKPLLGIEKTILLREIVGYNNTCIHT